MGDSTRCSALAALGGYYLGRQRPATPIAPCGLLVGIRAATGELLAVHALPDIRPKYAAKFNRFASEHKLPIAAEPVDVLNDVDVVTCEPLPIFLKD